MHHLHRELDLAAEYVRTAIAAIKARGIEFICLQEIVPDEWMSSPRRISYGCFWLLRERRPAIVHFNDYLGNGYYTAQAPYHRGGAAKHYRYRNGARPDALGAQYRRAAGCHAGTAGNMFP